VRSAAFVGDALLGALVSGPDDTIPPGAPPPEEEYVIEAGQARAAVVVVLADLARSVGRAGDVMQALARALDETAATPGGRP
jgi:hypothetical protein